MGRRHFGAVRQLPSGRWQARYRGPDGVLRPAPITFERKSDAARWLSLAESQIAHGTWVDPHRGEVPLKEYAEAWIEERPNLRPKTVELYRSLLRRHIVPELGEVMLNGLSTERVRAWAAPPASVGGFGHDDGEGVPVAAGDHVDCGRRRAGAAQPVPDQGGEPRADPGAAGRHARSGAPARREGARPLQGARPAGDVRQPALGRAGRAAATEPRP